MFQLEVLKAKYGDCLLLHHSDPITSTRILIDGGPTATYLRALKPRLTELQAENGTSRESVMIDLLMVSHIDTDHIGGINKLFKDWTTTVTDHQPPLIDIRALWHNSFPDIVCEPTTTGRRGVVPAGLGQNRLLNAWPTEPALHDSKLVLQGVKQGRTLRKQAERHAVAINPGCHDQLVLAGHMAEFGNLTLQVLGPTQRDVDALKKEWAKQVKKILIKEGAKPAAHQLDTAVANLSSIVVLAEAQGRRMLLTGDARGDKVLEGLRDTDLLKSGTIHVDLFKWPHHGSIRNFPEGFFRTVTADHHIVSANGRHGNPDLATFTQFFAERPKDQPCTLHMTYAVDDLAYGYPTDDLSALFDQAKADGHNFEIKTPEANMISLNIELEGE